MVVLPHPAARDDDGTPLTGLVRLRWGAVGLQGALLLLAHAVAPDALPWALLVGIVAGEALSNVGLALFAPRVAPPDSEALAAVLMMLDTAALSTLLHQSGGASNPLSILLVLPVTLAAVMLDRPFARAVALAAIAGYGALFLSPRALPEALGGHAHMMPSTDRAFSVHLHGMAVAFAATSVLVSFFVGRVRADLLLARAHRARAERLASLATLAAGAAHELATPLATIKVVATELERSLEAHPGLQGELDDVRLVRAEVARGRAILDRLAGSAGQLPGEAPSAVSFAALAARVRIALGPLRGDRVEVQAPTPDTSLVVPVMALTEMLANLVRNGLDAGDPTGRVVLRLWSEGDSARFEVLDEGAGMSPEVLARAGEPFFTTKPPGEGMGLGLFVVKSVVSQLGGSMSAAPRRPRGTAMQVSIPMRMSA